MDLEDLRDEYKFLTRRNEEIGKQAKAEDRAFTKEEQDEIADNMKQADAIMAKIEDGEKSEAIQSKIEEQAERLRQPVARKGQPIPLNNGEPRNAEPRIEFQRYAKLKGFKNELDAYKSGQWIRATIHGDTRAARWCRDHGMDVETRAHSETINSKGGALVPNEFAQTVIDLREQYGVFRRYAKIQPMNRDTITLARVTGGLTAYWASENTAITESNKTWDNVELVAKKLGVYALVPSELNEDAIVNMADDLAMEAARAFALKEDQTGFIGDGTATYNGILGVAAKIEANTGLAGYINATSGTDTFAEIDIEDISNVMGALPEYARANAAFFCSRPCHDIVFQRLAASAGGNTIQSMSGMFQPSFLGYPIVITQVLPTTTSTINNDAFFLFGDLSMAATMGDRREFSFATSNDYKFAEDQIAIKATERVDINVHDVGSTTAAGPIVALIGNT